MKIYTKTGDKGTTSLIGGKRVPKYHERIEAYGTVDELNAYIGLISTQNTNSATLKVLKEIQDRLFTIGATLAADPETSRTKIPDLHQEDITLLETEMDKMSAALPALKHFVLPGGTEAVSFCHVARCVCRRAERLTVALAEEHEVEEKIIIYLNRLSDYLFLLSRMFNFEAGTPENIWIPRV